MHLYDYLDSIISLQWLTRTKPYPGRKEGSDGILCYPYSTDLTWKLKVENKDGDWEYLFKSST
jgi:hypothetical protein